MGPVVARSAVVVGTAEAEWAGMEGNEGAAEEKEEKEEEEDDDEEEE
jgi:ribosomal protein L12E/L44/L45/RPP1/RPP2